MLWLIRQILFLRSAILTKETPRQLALGVACGVMLGLVPKGNLLAFGLAALIFGTRVSLPTGMLTALAVSLVATFLDPLTHAIGNLALTSSFLQPVWLALYKLPFAAWTSLNNTVVMGSFLVSLAAFYPVYRISLPWFERRQRQFVAEQERVSRGPDLITHRQPIVVSPNESQKPDRRRCA